MNPTPTVSFVVPCYKLAHYLRECVDSILAQTYEDFEVLVMDDCSPDDTPDVAASFDDPRVIHVRHRQNVGHLRNYNDGIARARGEYVWLISADDWLRSPTVLQQFVDVLEAHPGVTFAFAQAMKVDGGRDVAAYPRTAPVGVTSGQTFLERALLDYNCVPAAGAIGRKSAYVRVGYFPLDLPHSGDWFIWAAFALYGDVAYIPEPLVNYRQHEDSMSRDFSANKIDVLIYNEIAVRWRIKRMADEAGMHRVVAACRRTIADEYVRRLRRENDPSNAFFAMTQDRVSKSIASFATTAREAARTRADVLEGLGDNARAARTLASARGFYAQAIATDPVRPKTWAKYAMARLGGGSGADRVAGGASAAGSR
jgi:glycosyltransferase involved in cell wall biosynthesis